MSLLTAAVGMVVLVVIIFRFFQELFTRPVRMIRTLHASPILFLGILGAILGTLHALWKQQLLPLFMSSVETSGTAVPYLGPLLLQWVQNQDIYAGSGSTVDHASDSSYVDLIMLWGLFRGLIYGVEIGSVWLIVLGDSSNPTLVARCFYRRLWRPLKRYYRRSIGRRETKRLLVSPTATRTFCNNGDCDAVPTVDGDDKHQCVICLEVFSDGEEMDDSVAFAPGRYRLLPCMHCFHRECAHHWLTIKQTCPICRVEVEGMEGCGSVELTSNDDE